MMTFSHHLRYYFEARFYDVARKSLLHEEFMTGITAAHEIGDEVKDFVLGHSIE